jgi:excisionase family DNA binding protein
MEFLTVQETADMLKVSPITIRRYIASGRLAAVRAGRSLRIRREAIEDFVTPVEPNHHPDSALKGQPFTFDDPLWDIVGMIDDDGPADLSVNTDKYLADAYADLHEG